MSDKSVQLITDELIENVTEKARQSPRRRMNYNFHASNEDNPHRFLNVFLERSYVQPHRHLRHPKAESFIVLAGHMAAFTFDDDGNVTSGYILGPGSFSGQIPAKIAQTARSTGIDIAPGIWHTITAVSPVAVCYEVKPGPWDPATDKDMAPWAPPEGSAEVERYLDNLLRN